MSTVQPAIRGHQLIFRFEEGPSGGGHVQIRVWAGHTVGSLGLTGALVMRSDEWKALIRALEIADDRMDDVSFLFGPYRGGER